MKRIDYMALLTLLLGVTIGLNAHAGRFDNGKDHQPDFGFSTKFVHNHHSGHGHRRHNPFKKLQKQIEDLQEQIAELQAANDPVELTVDCTAGETVTDALDSIADSTAPATINIVGICIETISIERDDVTIRGGSTADGFQAPAGTTDSQVVLVQNGASGVKLETLSISGAFTGLGVIHDSAVETDGVEISGALLAGVLAVWGGDAFIGNSLLTNNNRGAVAAIGSVVVLSNTDVEFNDIGIVASSSSSVSLRPLPLHGKDFTENSALVNNIRNNTIGVFAGSSGSVFLTGTIIEQNTLLGMLAQDGGSFEFGGVPGGVSTFIQNNSGAGVVVQENANAQFAGDTVTITGNNGFGVFCEAGSSYTLLPGAVVTVTGNTAGDVFSGCN